MPEASLIRPPSTVTAAALVVAGALALAGPAGAAGSSAAPLNRVDLSNISRGSLLIPDPEHPGLYQEAPAVETRFDVKVAGLIARTTVRQRFTNPSSGFVEMLYVFPLSETSAVDELKMIVGERIIEGQIAEKNRARRVYAAAKEEGKRASLVEQVRPNLFSTSLANVAPGETVDIVIGTSDALHYQAGRVTLRLPLAVTPRFHPAGADGTNAPVDLPATSEAPTPVTIDIDVDAGFPVAGVASPFHKVGVAKVDERGFVVASRGPVPADRDFVLTWDAKPLTAPTGAVFFEKHSLEERGSKGDGYALLMMVPPTLADDSDETRTPRETVFIIDSSGSMSGPSMEQAKKALALAVLGIDPRDSFSIIDFDDKLIPMSSSILPATAKNKEAAARFVDGLVADGGTVMAPALQLAFEQIDASRSRGRVQQVIFMTDGAVSNEDELFRLIHDRLGKTRLFTVGIGAAPNAYFMRKAAEMGRGTFTYVGSPDEVEPKMGELFAKLESPVLSAIEIDFGQGARVEAWPQKIPDLYLGEPLMVVARLDGIPKDFVVTGSMAGKPYRMAFDMPWPVEGAGVHKLWARKKVDSLTDAMRTGKSGLEPEILAVALEHHIVSELTSLVAVDVTPVRKDGEPLSSTSLPTSVPGMLPRGGTGWPLQLLFGALALVVATIWTRRGLA